MPLRKMNIDRQLIIKGASNMPREMKISYYRWIIQVVKSDDVELV